MKTPYKQREAIIGPIIKDMETARRQPGILDDLLAAGSHDEACNIWASFLAQAPNHFSKTHNRAMKILTAHMEGRVN